MHAFKRSGIINVVNLGPLWMAELLAFRRHERFKILVRDLGSIAYWYERGPPEGWALKANA